MPDNTPPDPLALLLEEHVIATLLGQLRLEAFVGADTEWSITPQTGEVTLGGHRFPLDAVGVETAADASFVWAWADEGFTDEQVVSAMAVQAIGARRGIAELVTEQVPLDQLDGQLAGLLAAGVAQADAYLLGEQEGITIVLLLRDPALAAQPLPPTALVSAMNVLLEGDMPLDHHRAVRRFADRLPEGFSARVEESRVVLRGPDQEVTAEFDELGRIARVDGQMVPAGEPPLPPLDDAGTDEDADADDGHVVTLGTVDLPDGRLVVCDPFTVAAPGVVQPLPGALPAGTHTVEVALVEDPAGGERVQTAYLFVREGDPVEWEPAGAVMVDSGVVCFAAAGAADRLADGGDAAVAPLEQALRASGEPTWEHGELEGLQAFSAGFGDGELEVFWGYDEEEVLVCVAIDCLPEWHVAEQRAHGGSPGRGLQRAYLVAGLLGTTRTPENAILVPPATNRELAALERRVVRGLLGEEEVEITVEPAFARDEDETPVSVRVAASGGPDPFDATVQVPQD